MEKYNVTLPDAVLAFKLLDTACLNVKSKRLALTACGELNNRLVKRNTSETGHGVFHRTKTTRKRKTERNATFQSGQLKQPLPWTNPLDKFGTKASMSDAEIFMTESLSSAIIDTACTRVVCGEKWLESYIDDLTQDQVNQLMQTETPSCRPFHFRDGNLVYSTRNMKLPVKIGLTKCKIESEVVKDDIPLQLSKTSLKKEGTILDMEKDSAVMFKQSIPLEFTSSGHYCVDIRDKETKTGQTEEEVTVTVTVKYVSR